jgi:hypothetical protein
MTLKMSLKKHLTSWQILSYFSVRYGFHIISVLDSWSFLGLRPGAYSQEKIIQECEHLQPGQ